MINNIYLKKKVVSEMEEFFNDNGFIQLNDILTENYKEFRDSIVSENLIEVYEPLICKKKTLNLKEIYKLEIIRIIEFFKSKEFLEFIEDVTDFELVMESLEINVYSKGDFTSLEDDNKSEENLIIIYDLSDEFTEKMGGVLTFMTDEEEVFCLDPSYNSLSIFFNPIEVTKYLKEINEVASSLNLIRVEMKFSPIE